MGVLGSVAGGALGKQLGGDGIGGDILGGIGGVLGSLFPFFETGGWVNHPVGQPVVSVLHGGEFVLPQSISPTKKQVEAVRRIKALKKHNHKFV